MGRNRPGEQVSWDDPAKAASRRWQLEFAKKHMPGKPESIKVLCFPGRDALEILQIYRPLGIPDRNILGLERDATTFAYLEDRIAHDPEFPQINILNAADADFLRTTHEGFSWISLDYCGTFSWPVEDSLRFISGRELLESGGLFFINLQAAREREMATILSFVEQSISMIKENPLNLFYRHGSDVPPINPDKRSFALTRYILDLLDYGKVNIGPDPLLSRLPGHESIRQKILRNMCGLAAKPELMGWERAMYTRQKELMMQGALTNVTIYQLELAERFGQIMQPYGFTVDLVTFMLASQAGGYQPKAMARSSYISNKPSPMMSDIYKLQKTEDILHVPQDVFRVEYDKGMRIFLADLLVYDSLNKWDHHDFARLRSIHKKKVQEARKECERAYRTLTSMPHVASIFPAREYLGSSAPSRKRIDDRLPLTAETKQEVLGYLVMAMDDGPDTLRWARDFLTAEYQVTSGQLSAFQAHITQGTYRR